MESFHAVASVTALLALLKAFKYLRLNNRLMLMWRTLDMALGDLVAFMIIFFIIFVGYTTTAYLAFGQEIADFHGLWSSFMALFGMLLGEYNHTALVEASPRFSGFFFASFMVLVFLTTVNVFIAMYVCACYRGVSLSCVCAWLVCSFRTSQVLRCGGLPV